MVRQKADPNKPATPDARQKPDDPADASGAQAAGVRSIERVLAILSLFSDERPRMSVADIVRATGLPKTTVLRHVATLQANGLVWQEGDSRYVLGPRILRWAGLAARAWELPAAARAAMEDAVSRCEEALHLYVRQGITRVCVARVEAPRSLRYVVGIGDELPLWGGGVSKVLLTGATPKFLLEVAESAPGGGETLESLKASVEQTRADGYGTSHAELEPGLSSVAVPVRDATGHVVAAVSFGGPTARFGDERIATFVTELRKVAEVMATSHLTPWPTQA